MKLYAISEIHGCYSKFKKTLEELNIIEQLKNKTAKLIFPVLIKLLYSFLFFAAIQNFVPLSVL
jgi:hypothetical protein